MADQQDRGLLGMFGKKHEEGSHGQPAPYTEQGGYKYGETELHHSSPQSYTYDATQVHHAPPTATYSEDIYGISKPHDKQGEEKSHGLFGKLHDKHDSSSSSSSDEEEKGGGRRKKKGLKEKIKEKLPGHHGTGNEEGEKYGGEEKKHGLFGH